jgi:hypothetical protein
LTQIFPEWANKLPIITLFAVILFIAGIIGFFWYYGSPKFTDVGYRPIQPIQYSHKLHPGDLGLDCRYCHSSIERSAVANVPPNQTCMNCHRLILTASEKLLPVRESWANQLPIKWTRVHKLPDFAYFDHSVHLAAGVGCFSCHGNVANMDVVTQEKPLSMGWCLDCHRNPGPNLRPREEITNMEWAPPDTQAQFAARVIREKNIAPPTECSGCHR